MGTIFSSLRATHGSAEDLSLAQPIFQPILRPDITEINVNKLFENPRFRNIIAKRLAGAVKIPTVTYDEMSAVGEDPRWEIFYEFSRYLRETFPKVYEVLEITTINEHAFLYTWKGSESALKPLLFMAHSDVVPAPESTSDRWTHPPFSGHCDGDFIWGRGSADDKSNVIAKLSALEALLEAGFEPSRTVILALGFDEEGGADKSYGARCLAEHLLHIYGEDAIEMILDEGTLGIDKRWGTDFAIPASAEKGYVDITVTIDMAGGHSSTPPDHTAIGYLAQIIQKIEDNQFPSRLTNKNPIKTYLQTAARHAKTMDKDFRDAILDPKSTDKVIEHLNRNPYTRALLRTSTAVDVIQGGVKSNALPETASVLINHRIAVEESVQDVQDHYEKILSPLVKKWDLTHTYPASQSNEKFSTFGSLLTWKSDSIKLSIHTHGALEPSPVSSSTDSRFSWLAGTIRGVFGNDIIVAPVLETGNTDTKFYWKLSPQIYRVNPYQAKWDPKGLRIHTVDERMPVDGLLEMVRFYHEFIRVVDERRA